MSALHVNGIDATTGEHLLPPLDEHVVARAAQTLLHERGPDPKLESRFRRLTERQYAPKHGVDPRDLGAAGWAVVVAADADPAVLAALRPLLEHRRRQASSVSEGRYRVLAGADGYRLGESKQDFLARLGVGPGPVDPDVLPYHLLLVGRPDEIPFEVQYQLDVQYAVGRLCFDEVLDYAQYAENVVAAEGSTPKSSPPRMRIFAPDNEGDPATSASEAYLARPLADGLTISLPSWEISSLLGPNATKANLLASLTGDDRPDLLFTASHGTGYPCGHPEQRLGQGSLVCQDWQGSAQGPLLPGQLFGASDVRAAREMDLSGLVAVLFACFGAGTPLQDDFARARGVSQTLAPAPFVSALPQALLGREGGALAVVGHVDRAWGYSFIWPGAGSQTEVFRSSLASLADGYPVGAAFEFMNDRHAEIATELARTLEMISLGKKPDDQLLAALWTAYADARNFVILGDPAVRLGPAASPAEAVPQPRSTSLPSVSSDQTAESRSAAEQLEVATYVTEDPTAVDIDPSTGGIRGARLFLYSRVGSDGRAQHVVARPSPLADEDADAERAVTEIHARLLEVSLQARRKTGK